MAFFILGYLINTSVKLTGNEVREDQGRSQVIYLGDPSGSRGVRKSKIVYWIYSSINKKYFKRKSFCKKMKLIQKYIDEI